MSPSLALLPPSLPPFLSPLSSLKVLLSLGASPNYIDAKGQTPLYHAAIMGDDVSVCELLLKNNSIVMNTDNIGWTELHQVRLFFFLFPSHF